MNGNFMQAWKNWRAGTASNVVDSVMRGGSTTEIMRCIHIALLCVQEDANDRPTMNSIIVMLNSNTLSLPVPSRPAFFMQSNFELDTSTELSDYTNSDNHQSRTRRSFAQASINGASITDPYPR